MALPELKTLPTEADIDAKDAEILRLRAEVERLAIPDGYVLMPSELTAENGAKHLLIGEFTEQTPTMCPVCFGGTDGSGPDHDCEICDGEGELLQGVPVSWTTIKDIYSKAVQGLAK